MPRPVFWAAQSVPTVALLALLVAGVRRSAANRRAGETVTETRRTAGDVLAELRHQSSSSPAEFYRLAAECFDRTGFRPESSTGAELRELYATAQQSTYAGVSGAPPLDAAKRDAAIRLLTDLVR